MAEEFSEIARTCACFHFRRTSRAVTNLYNQSLRPTGLTSTQFVALLAIHLSESVPMSRMAETLGMDRTTLTRLLSPLKNKQLIRIRAGKDKRVQILTLTERGTAALTEAIPRWREAQNKVLQVFGIEKWENLLTDLETASRLST